VDTVIFAHGVGGWNHMSYVQESPGETWLSGRKGGVACLLSRLVDCRRGIGENLRAVSSPYPSGKKLGDVKALAGRTSKHYGRSVPWDDHRRCGPPFFGIGLEGQFGPLVGALGRFLTQQLKDEAKIRSGKSSRIRKYVSSEGRQGIPGRPLQAIS